MWTPTFVMMGALIVVSLLVIYLFDKPTKNHVGVLIAVAAFSFVGAYGFNVLGSAGG